MAGIADIRAKYPQYQDLTDEQLADGLYKKFYSDMPRDQFNQKLGLGPVKLKGTVAPKEDVPAGMEKFSDLPYPGNPNFNPGGKPQGSTNIEIAGSGVPMNIAAGVNDTITGIAGAPVDLTRNTMNWAIGAFNALSGADDLTKGMVRNAIGDKQWWQDALSKVGVRDPDSVVASTLAEKLARAGGEAAAATLVPELIVGTLAKSGATAKQTTEVLTTLFGEARSAGSMAKNAIAGTAGGVAAQGAMQAAPDNLKPLAGVLGGLAGGGLGAAAGEVPGLARAAGKVAGDYVAPLSVAGREQLAGETLRNAADNPEAAITTLQGSKPLVPGSTPTTFQATGDMGLGALERGAATKDPAAFQQRRADQNAARVAELADVQGQGSPEVVAASVRQYMEMLDQQANAAIEAATATARQPVEALGTGMTPDVAGTTARQALEAARATAKAQERALWDAVDPEGTLVLPVAKTTAAAEKIAGELPRMAKPMGGEEAAIFKDVSTLDNSAPLSEITALQSRIKTEMRNERVANGESAAYRRLSQLNAAVQSDLEGAIVQKVAQEQQAVAAGQMKVADTIEQRFQRQVEKWRAERAQAAAGEGAGKGSGLGGAAGQAPLAGVSGTGSQGGQRLGSAARDSGLSPNGAGTGQPVDQATLDRLKTARAATKQRVETFDNSTLAPIRARPSTVSPYEMPAGAVPAKIFFAGPKSFDAIMTLKNAAPEAMNAITAYAIDRMRRAALREDGTLDPAKLASWRRTHSDALRALPGLDARLQTAEGASSAMAEAAIRQRQALDDAQMGIIGKVMGVEDPADVVKTVGSIFGRADAVRQMRRLRDALGNDPKALEALKTAVGQYMADKLISNTEVATSGQAGLKSDQFQTFIKSNEYVLKAAGFEESDIRRMQAVAADLQRANRSLTAVKIPGQSNTAQDILAVKPNDSLKTAFGRLFFSALATAAGTATGGLVLGMAAGIGAGAVSVLRQRGIRQIDDLVRDALLDPKLATELMVKARPKEPVTDSVSTLQRVARGASSAALVPLMGGQSNNTLH